MKIPSSPYLGISKRALDFMVRDQVSSLPAFEARADQDWDQYIKDKSQLKLQGVLLGLIFQHRLPEMDLETALFMHDRYTKEFYSNANEFTTALKHSFSPASLQKCIDGYTILEGLDFAK